MKLIILSVTHKKCSIFLKKTIIVRNKIWLIYIVNLNTYMLSLKRRI